MKIQILGTGCPKCSKLAENARQAVSELGIEAEVIKVTDLDEIMSFGVLLTPGFAVDGVVKAVGTLLSPKQIREILTAS